MHAQGSLNMGNRADAEEDLLTNAEYRMISCEDGRFAVEVARPGMLPQKAAGFATEAEASAWIAQDKKLWQAADPFRTPAGRNRRRF
jgi:hypothetical protein